MVLKAYISPRSESRAIHNHFSEEIVTGVSSGDVKIWGRDGKLNAELSVGDAVHIVRGNGQCLASGGKENPLKICDLSTLQQTFIAKNARVSFREFVFRFARIICNYGFASG